MNIKKVLMTVCASILVLASQAADVAGRSYTMPLSVGGVKRPVLSMNGTWDFRYSANSPWTSIRVPGEAAMQGYAIRHDQWFTYRRKMTVPADWQGKRVVLRFDGVYCHAILRVNGTQVREHHGGFTRWETDITRYVKPGQPFSVELDVEDRIDDISYASGYAHHPIGGILRDVSLMAMPENYVYDCGVETQLDTLYCDANLIYSFEYEGRSGAKLAVSLYDAAGRQVPIAKRRFAVKPGHNVISIPVKNPLKWDAEHPNLYTFNTTLTAPGKSIMSTSQEVGFRDIKVVKDRLLVNGRQVKLRGACRHDINPFMGRGTTAEDDSLDARLFHEANMNFVRTSHYPPNERFLKFCDRYGIYVESETACCFVDTHRQKNYAPGATQNDPAFTERYLGQLQEMVKTNRSHASVLMWSIGNESVYGKNFQICYDWVKNYDKTRPVIFSYPGTAKEKGAKIYDILSLHYPSWNGSCDQWGFSIRGFEQGEMPTIFDEWAHPACYTYATLQEDPNIREFWGKSLDLMWNGVYNATGALGGAIWCYADDIFELPEPKVGDAFWKTFAHTAKPEGYQGKCVGYGEWGIVDIWRRKKPEFWATKKAHSPVRLDVGKVINVTSGEDITLTVYNRFDQTNLNEVKMRYTYRGTTKTATMPDVEPHKRGLLVIPAEKWQDAERVKMEFLEANGSVIDSYNPVIGKETIDYPELAADGSLSIEANDGQVVVKGNGFVVPFDLSTGLITHATAGGEEIISRGPLMNMYVNYNHLSGAEVRKIADHYVTADSIWTLTDINWSRTDDGNACIKVSGKADMVAIKYQIVITPRGKMTITYTTDGLPNGYLRETGLRFWLGSSMERLKWKRNGYWESYPDKAFAGNDGDCYLFRSHQAGYAETPTQAWQDDTHNYYYWADRGAVCDRPLTMKAKGMKENVYYYTLSTNGGHSVSVVDTQAQTACRLHQNAKGNIALCVDNQWDYPEIAWGNYCKVIEALPCYGRIEMILK